MGPTLSVEILHTMVTTADEQERTQEQEHARELTREKQPERELATDVERLESGRGLGPDAPKNDPEVARAVADVEESQKSLRDRDLIENETNQPESNQEAAEEEAPRLRQWNARMRSLVDPGLRSLAAAIKTTEKTASQLSKTIESGSRIGILICLGFSALLDVADMLLGPETGGLYDLLIAIVKAFLFVFIFLSIPRYGGGWRQRQILRTLVLGGTDALPFISVLPLETAATVWLLHVTDQKRSEYTYELAQIQKRLDTLKKMYVRRANTAWYKRLPQE